MARKFKAEAKIATAPIDGEAYSTAKMLNEIKASHPDVNVYMNTIVDEAIKYYYCFGFKKKFNIIMYPIFNLLS
jgi:hypothetical protein